MTRRLFIALAVFAALSFLPTVANAQAGKGWAAPKSGVWRVTGKDDGGVRWHATMHLAARGRVGSGSIYRGYFDWRSADGMHSGRETFNANFDRASGLITIVGRRVTRVKGDVAPGRYRGHLSNRGRKIVRGTWGGSDIVNGKWSAVWPGPR